MLTRVGLRLCQVRRDHEGNVIGTTTSITSWQYVGAAVAAFCVASALFGFFSAAGRAAFEALAGAAGGC